MTKKRKIDLNEIQDNNYTDFDYFSNFDNKENKENKENNKETIVYTDLKQYKKAIDKYCFTISFGCMFKIGLLLIGSTLLTIFKVWLYITYC
jgi:hypothetical protein